MRIRLVFVATFLIAGVAACGGGGGGSAPASGVLPHAADKTPAVSIRMLIPASTTAALHARRPAYVSPGVLSIVYQITAQNGTTPLVSGANYTNIASPSPCQSGTSGLTCTIAIAATIGSSATYDLTIATYDAAQTAACTPAPAGCTGHLLGLATLPESITVGSTTPVSVTLGGVPALFVPVSMSGYAAGLQHSNNGLTIFGPQPQTGSFELADASGNVIIDPGAPQVTVSPQTSSALTIALPSPNAGLYTATFTAVKSGNYVQPGTYSETLTAAVANTSITANMAFQVSIQHSALFIGTCSFGLAAVYGYLDGNTNGASPDTTISTALDCESENAPGIATDGNGNLYIADSLGAFQYAIAPGSQPSPIATAGSAQGLNMPASITVDRDGNVYIGDTSNGILVFASPGPAGFASPLATIPNSAIDGYSPGGLAANDNGNLYVAVQLDGDLAIYAFPSVSAGLNSGSSGSQLVLLTPSQYTSGTALALDVQPSSTAAPNIWLGGEAAPSDLGSLWNYNPGGALAAQYETGLGEVVQGVAVDGKGTVYAALYTGSVYQVVTLAPPGYAVGPSIVPPAVNVDQISVAVAPAAAIMGSSTGGSPSPIDSLRSLRH